MKALPPGIGILFVLAAGAAAQEPGQPQPVPDLLAVALGERPRPEDVAEAESLRARVEAGIRKVEGEPDPGVLEKQLRLAKLTEERKRKALEAADAQVDRLSARLKELAAEAEAERARSRAGLEQRLAAAAVPPDGRDPVAPGDGEGAGGAGVPESGRERIPVRQTHEGPEPPRSQDEDDEGGAR